MTSRSAAPIRLPLTVLAGALGVVLVAPAHALAAAGGAAPPAGGAEIGQVIGASMAAMLLTGALLVFGQGHRTGRIRVLGRCADLAGGVSGLPPWVALPAGLGTVSLVSAVFGLYWDVSLHIDNGRDPGPLANPSHYFILLGLFGIFAAGWLAIVLPTERPGPAAIRIAPGWEAPVSGFLMMACASFALLGFPLDDVSHRLFGQDVTLWGPTHLMMLSGAALTLVGMLGLLVEGRLARRGASRPAAASLPPLGLLRASRVIGSRHMRTVRLVSACGGLLIGLSIYQGEFDFGVPQFRLLFAPLLIALAASVALVAARVLVGRGAALGAVAFFLVVRGALTLLVGPVLGETTAHFPLYIAEGLLVEGVAFAVSPRRPYRFGLAAGALVGTGGVLAEWGWSQVWMPIPWPAHLLPDAIAHALPVALAGGVIGAFVGGALRLRADVAATPRAWAAAVASVLVIGGAIAHLVPTSVPAGVSAAVTLEPAHPAPDRTAWATVRLHPADAARGADWLDVTAWQGHGKLVVEPLRRVGPGVYRTAKRIPVHGHWKTMIRLHRGSTLASVPVYLPADPAIPAAEVAASARFVRPFTADHQLLQRERKRDVPTWLWGVAGLVVLAISSALIGALGWGMARLAGRGAREVANTPPPAVAQLA